MPTLKPVALKFERQFLTKCLCTMSCLRPLTSHERERVSSDIASNRLHKPLKFCSKNIFKTKAVLFFIGTKVAKHAVHLVVTVQPTHTEQGFYQQSITDALAIH